jgi:UDP-glucose 4-epimerase
MNLVHGDVRDPDQMTKLLREQSVVFHLAALMSVPHSTEAPSSYLYTNVMGTQNVLRGAQDAHRIVITSTSEVYGTAQSVPI